MPRQSRIKGKRKGGNRTVEADQDKIVNFASQMPQSAGILASYSMLSPRQACTEPELNEIP